MPTPTLLENMHLISYAQCSLKIVFLWCKVRSKFDGLSLAHSRWFFVFKAPSVYPALEKYSLPENHSKCPQNESETERQRGRISVTI